MRLVLMGLLASALVHTGSPAPADRPDCSKMDELLDELGAAQGISTLNNNYKLFTDLHEMGARCKQMGEAIKTLRKYNKECYSALTQQVFSAILRTRARMNEAKCRLETPEALQVLASVRCLHDNVGPVRQAELAAIQASEAILAAGIGDERLRVRRSCCGVLEGKRLFMEATRASCGQHEQVYSDYVDSYTSEAMSLICPAEEKLQCQQLPSLDTVSSAPASGQNRSTFFLKPMLKIVQTLDH